MITDPFAAMADSLSRFSADLHGLIQANRGLPAPGSPAAKEIDEDRFGGEWGNPARSAVGHLALSAASCQDHLKAAAILIRSRAVVLSLQTVTRGAAEAAALGAYVSEAGVEQRERVRRILNLRLSGMQSDRNALQRFTGPEAVERIAALDESFSRFERAAAAHGFTFVQARGYRAPHLDTATPSTTALLGKFVSPSEDLLGKTYYSGLSSVAHSQLNGLLRKLMAGSMNATARDTALELLAGPLCASTLVENMLPYLGWDADAVNGSIPAMFGIWGEIAECPYPGPTSPADEAGR